MKVKMNLISIVFINKACDQVSSYNLELEENDEQLVNTFLSDALLTNTQKLKEAIESLEMESREAQSNSAEGQPIPSNGSPSEKSIE